MVVFTTMSFGSTNNLYLKSDDGSNVVFRVSEIYCQEDDVSINYSAIGKNGLGEEISSVFYRQGSAITANTFLKV